MINYQTYLFVVVISLPSLQNDNSVRGGGGNTSPVNDIQLQPSLQSPKHTLQLHLPGHFDIPYQNTVRTCTVMRVRNIEMTCR